MDEVVQAYEVVEIVDLDQNLLAYSLGVFDKE
jgi:hypothetical protein